MKRATPLPYRTKVRMPPQRVCALPRQKSLFLPAVLNPFVQEVKLAKADVIKVSMTFIVVVEIYYICSKLNH